MNGETPESSGRSRGMAWGGFGGRLLPIPCCGRRKPTSVGKDPSGGSGLELPFPWPSRSVTTRGLRPNRNSVGAYVQFTRMPLGLSWELGEYNRFDAEVGGTIEGKSDKPGLGENYQGYVGVHFSASTGAQTPSPAHNRCIAAHRQCPTFGAQLGMRPHDGGPGAPDSHPRRH